MQRVAIARALALPPKLLLADEPTGNLDPDSAARVMALFRELNRAGMSILLVTHNPEWVAPGTRRTGRCTTGIWSGPAGPREVNRAWP